MSGNGHPLATGIVKERVPLGPLTTYKAGGPARLFAEIGSVDDLMSVVDSGLARDHPIVVLGRGSNLVVADAGFDGLVIHLGAAFATVEVNGDLVYAGGSTPLPRVARAAVEDGVLGAEYPRCRRCSPLVG